MQKIFIQIQRKKLTLAGVAYSNNKSCQFSMIYLKVYKTIKILQFTIIYSLTGKVFKANLQK